MNVAELIAKLKSYPSNATVLVSSDEELNNLFRDVQLSYLTDSGIKGKVVVIWGNSGSELDR